MSLSKSQERKKLNEDLFWLCSSRHIKRDIQSYISAGANPNWKAPPWSELDHYILFKWNDWFFIRYSKGLIVWNGYCVIRFPDFSGGWFHYLMDEEQRIMYSNLTTDEYNDTSLVTEVQVLCDKVKENSAVPLEMHSCTLLADNWRLVITEKNISIINCYEAKSPVIIKKSAPGFIVHNIKGQDKNITARSPSCKQFIAGWKLSTSQTTFKLHNGWSCLHMAVYRGFYSVVKYLLEKYHADVTVTDDGERLIDLVGAQGDKYLAKYVEEFIGIDESKRLLKKHLQKQGSLNIRCLKGLFMGPAGVGKTSSKMHIMREPYAPTKSTCIDKPVTVPLFHRTEGSTACIAGEWESSTINAQIKTVLGLASLDSTIALKPDTTFSTTPSTQLSFFSNTHIATERQSGNIFSQSDVSGQSKVFTQSMQTSNPTGAPSKLLQLTETSDWMAVRKRLEKFEDVTFLNIIDVGGQPEIQEVLPLLLHGRALNLVFFNMAEELDEPYNITFRHEDSSQSIEYKSEFTVCDIINQILTSISSLQHDTEDGNQPAVLLIGTHFDEFEAQQKDIFALEKVIQEYFKETEFFRKDIVRPISIDNEGVKRYIFPLDNTKREPEKLRKLIMNVLEDRFPPTQIPTAWLLFHLKLRMEYENSPGWCTIEEAEEVAAKCGVLKDELPKVLLFLNNNLGTILHYPGVEGLENLIICDVNIIMKPISNIFANSFSRRLNDSSTTEAIRKSGEIPKQHINKICASFSSSSPSSAIPTSHVLAVLKNHHIIFEMATSFFMPSLLYPDHNVIKETHDANFIACLSPTPLLFIPSTGCVPLGIFIALGVILMEDKDWFVDDKRFRNHLYFHVPINYKLIRVELISRLQYIELRVDHGVAQCKEVISLQDKLQQALDLISRKYLLHKEVEWKIGFYCPGTSGKPHPAVYHTGLLCSNFDKCDGHPFPLEDKHMFWREKEQLPSGSSSISNRVPTVKSLNSELRELLEWYQLGIQLEVEKHKLDMIYKQYHIEGVSVMKIQMFEVWLKSDPEASWDKLVTALIEIGQDRIAQDLERIHLPSSSQQSGVMNGPLVRGDIRKRLFHNSSSVSQVVDETIECVDSHSKLTCSNILHGILLVFVVMVAIIILIQTL